MSLDNLSLGAYIHGALAIALLALGGFAEGIEAVIICAIVSAAAAYLTQLFHVIATVTGSPAASIGSVIGFVLSLGSWVAGLVILAL